MPSNAESGAGDTASSESTSEFLTSETIPLVSSETASVTMDFEPSAASCECMQTEASAQSKENKDQSTSKSTLSGTSQNSGTSITTTSGTSVSSNTENNTAPAREIQ